MWRYDRLDASCKRLPVGVIGAEKDLYSIQAGGISQALETELFGPIDGTFGPMAEPPYLMRARKLLE